jgi:homoserine dehydrogenase
MHDPCVGRESSEGPSCHTKSTVDASPITVRPRAVTSKPERLRALLLGAGSLGRAFLRRLRDKAGPIDLVGVITAHHGRMLQASGVDPSLALNMVESEGLGESAPEDFKKLLEVAQPNVIVECIPQNIRSGEPALTYLRTALDMGIHVVTSNKAPIVLGYRDLRHRAAKADVQFRFEATVLDGLPLFTLMSNMPQVQVTRVRGVFNATSSVVLESVQVGSSRSRGLARAQAQGIAEADSVLDLDGWDAAAKVALIANVWMGGALRVVDVARTGCDAIKDEKIRESAEHGAHYRLVGEVERREDGQIAKATVEPIALEPGDPLYPLRGPAGGVIIDTDQGHSFTMLQRTSGIDDAAFGMMQDCLAILSGAAQV